MATRILAGAVLGCLLATAPGYPPASSVGTGVPAVGDSDLQAPAARLAATADRVHAVPPDLADARLLGYDPRGRGTVVEVFGDLTDADRIVVVVPGSDVDLANYVGPRQLRSMAQAVYDEASAQGAHRVAVIAWAGYVTPVGLGLAAARSDLAEAGAVRFLWFLTGLAPYVHAEIGLMCHSYGSVVCARAAPLLARTGVDVRDIVVFGSPGMDVSNAAELATSARIWAARSLADWIRWVPNVRLLGVGHGTDPTDQGFGARVVPVPDADGHDGYLLPGTTSLHRLTAAALGYLRPGRGRGLSLPYALLHRV